MALKLETLDCHSECGLAAGHAQNRAPEFDRHPAYYVLFVQLYSRPTEGSI